MSGIDALSDEDRERLVEAFEGHNADYLELADTLGIKRSTARSIVATYLRTGRRHKLHRGGAKNQKMDDEMRARIQRIIDVNPLVTLQQIKGDLEAALPLKPTVTISTILWALDGMFITLKLAEDVPDGRNAPQNLDLRVVGPYMASGSWRKGWWPIQYSPMRPATKYGHADHMAGPNAVNLFEEWSIDSVANVATWHLPFPEKWALCIVRFHARR